MNVLTEKCVRKVSNRNENQISEVKLEASANNIKMENRQEVTIRISICEFALQLVGLLLAYAICSCLVMLAIKVTYLSRRKL